MSDSDSGGGEYEIGKILKHRKKGSKYEYLIRWREFGKEEDSWEPTENLTHCREVVEQYNRLFLTPQVAGPSSGRKSPSRMPAKTRSRSSSRSRSTSKSRTTGKRASSKSPARSTGKRRSSPARMITTEVVVVKKVEESPARQSRTGRSPTRESLSRRTLDVAEGKSAIRAAKVERSEVVVRKSWSATSGATRSQALEDSDTKTWFGERRREMLRKLDDDVKDSSETEEEEVLLRPKAKKPAAIEAWSASSGWTLKTFRPPTSLRIRSMDIPIIVFVACLIVISVTFIIEEFF